MKSLIEHLEEHLGRIDAGVGETPEGEKLPFSIAIYSQGPCAEVKIYTTVGLSRFPLHTRRTPSKHIYHELMIMARVETDMNIPAVMVQVGLEAISSNYAYLRGGVIGPRGTLFSNTQMEAFFVTSPACLPDSFEYFDTGSETIVIPWLIPITKVESDFIKQYGWIKFEELLDKEQPDLFDLRRNSIV